MLQAICTEPKLQRTRRNRRLFLFGFGIAVMISALGLSCIVMASEVPRAADSPLPVDEGTKEASSIPISQAQGQLVLDLEMCLDLALKNNAEYKNAMWDLELARIDLEKTEADQPINPNPSLLRQKRLAFDRSKENLDGTRIKVQQETERRFFDLLRYQEMAALNLKRVEQTRNDLEIAKLKVKLGMESQAALLEAEKALLAAEKAYTTSLTTLALAKMNFLLYLGVEDIEREFKLKEEEFQLAKRDYDEKECIERALRSNSQVRSYRDQLESAQLDLKLNATEFTSPVDRRRLEIAVSKAELALENEEKRVAIQVRQYISDLKGLENEMEQARLEVEINRQQYEAARVKYEKGMITLNQLLKEENALASAEQSFLEAKFRYRDKQQEFEDYMGIEGFWPEAGNQSADGKSK